MSDLEELYSLLRAYVSLEYLHWTSLHEGEDEGERWELETEEMRRTPLELPNLLTLDLCGTTASRLAVMLSTPRLLHLRFNVPREEPNEWMNQGGPFAIPELLHCPGLRTFHSVIWDKTFSSKVLGGFLFSHQQLEDIRFTSLGPNIFINAELLDYFNEFTEDTRDHAFPTLKFPRLSSLRVDYPNVDSLESLHTLVLNRTHVLNVQHGNPDMR